MRHFLENRLCDQNPDGVFFFYFNDRQKDQHERIVLEILRRLGRETVTVECTGLTARDIYRKASNTDGNTRTACEAFERMLLNENVALVFKDISRSKMSHRAEFVRSLLKIGDDAHFHGYRPVSDVVFIDAASFLEKGWDSISPYTRQIGPVDAFDAWFKTGSDPTPFAIE